MIQYENSFYNAISIDGFIAKKDGDSDWVSEADVDIFESKIKEAGAIIVGKNTFKQYEGELYPVEGVINYVVTSNPNMKYSYDNVELINEVDESILRHAKSKGAEYLLLVGGGNVNASFLKAGMLDEVILSVHPIILSEGIRLFEGSSFVPKLELISTKELNEGLVQPHYKILE